MNYAHIQSFKIFSVTVVGKMVVAWENKVEQKAFKVVLTGSGLRDSSCEKKRWPQKVKAISMHLEVQEVKVKRHSLQGHSEIYINAIEY